jgi:heme-degrading monooxygenase HmoA
MIARLWHGWTKPENADKYHNLLQSRILPEIHRVNGYQGAWLLRRESGAEVEFITLTLWETWEAIREFAGPSQTHGVVPEEARQLLSRFDEESVHYDGTWVP